MKEMAFSQSALKLVVKLEIERLTFESYNSK